MKYRALMFDIDGTLFDHECQISPKTLEILREKKDEGVYLAINSGRPVALSVTIIRQLCGDLFDMIIGSNGSEYYIEKTKERYLKTSFSHEQIKEIYSLFDHPDLTLGVYDDVYLLTQNDIEDDELNVWLSQRSVFCRKYNLKTDTRSFPKVLGLHAAKDHEKISEFLKTLDIPDYLETAFSSTRVLEICPRGSNKALGVKEVSEKLGISPKEIICFGDGENDLSMLLEGYGVVMGDGEESVKKAVGRVCGCSDEDGIYNYLRMLEMTD